MDPERVLADLRELAALTGGADGARRVCWTDEWVRARELLRARLGDLPVDVSVDVAGNLWADLPGEQEGFVLVGSHIDSVPGGGWLDGALGVFAAIEAVRTHAAAADRPAVGLRFVDWADEEGARFGRSLFGSSACAGTLDADSVRDLRDREGERLQDVVGRFGVDLDRHRESGAQLQGARAYLELHIEQGPVLESRGEPAAAVLGTFGVERHVAVFTGQAAHAGATPMTHRHDSFAAAARAALAIREVGLRHEGGVCTVGGATSDPGVVTAVAGRTEMLLDQRHLDADALAEMLAEARAACVEAAAEYGCSVELEHLWSIPPIPFDDRLIALARQAVVDAGGEDTAIPSGPLHDAAEMARLIPTVMVFSSSSPPVSHTKEEDTPEADLRVAIDAYGRTVEATLAAVSAGGWPAFSPPAAPDDG
jgi:hydantoinase/carbamoylase family amidase